MVKPMPLAQEGSPHASVMLNEVLECMQPNDGELYVDGTFGAGGYSRALLKAADCKVYGIDRDPDVQVHADRLAADFPKRFSLLKGCYSDMDTLLAVEGIMGVHGVVLDIGVSSMQLDQAERGFSFMKDAPLDMRMGKEGEDAAKLVNTLPEEELANIIYQYGGERMSRRIAAAIVRARKETSITRTVQLAEIIRSAVRKYNDTIDPATRTFQALRIAVNDELGELERGLEAAEKILLPGGRLVVVSFHSLEDSIVKDFLRDAAGKEEGVSRYAPIVAQTKTPVTFTLMKTKALKPSDAETKTNPRARSAKLRAAYRTDIPTRYGA